jgi:hypothetical protein
MAPYSIEFTGPTRRTIQQAVELHAPLPGFESIGATDRMFVEILAPNRKTSSEATTEKLCR